MDPRESLRMQMAPLISSVAPPLAPEASDLGLTNNYQWIYLLFILDIYIICIILHIMNYLLHLSSFFYNSLTVSHFF